MFFPRLLLLFADVSDDPSSQYQRMCLYNVFRQSKEQRLIDTFTGNDPMETIRHTEKIRMDEFSETDKICHLEFENGILRTFEFVYWDFGGHLQLSYLPSFTETVIVRNSYLRRVLRTRTFPRNAREIDLRMNNIVGSAELGHLPSRLESLSVRRNKLDGVISLRFLPDSLKMLDLSWNFDLGQPLVVYDELPSKIVKIDFSRTRIRKVKPKEQQLKAKKRDLFVGETYFLRIL